MLGEIFLVIVLWLHLLAAAAWVGGAIFYLLVLAPALRMTPDIPRMLSTIIGVEFRTIVATSIIVLVDTGVVLAFNRLTEVELAYTLALGFKVVLSIWMFLLVRDRQQHLHVLKAFHDTKVNPTPFAGKVWEIMSGYSTLVVLGILILLISVIMDHLFETELRTE